MSLLTPEQYPVKHYSSEDAGAPQMSNADFVIKNIIKACLVTGYGDKVGAGWEALFESTNKIVLRRPLGTGSPVDVKITNGYGLHQVASQDNPSSIDDNSSLASTYFIARDVNFKAEWRLIASDFGFILCYQMGSGTSAIPRFNVLYIGSMMPLKDTGSPMLMLKSGAATLGGTSSGQCDGILGSGVSFLDMRTATNITTKSYLSLPLDSNEEFVQKIFIGNFLSPFYTSLGSTITNGTVGPVLIEGRPMLHWPNAMEVVASRRAMFIPLDYWEL